MTTHHRLWNLRGRWEWDAKVVQKATWHDIVSAGLDVRACNHWSPDTSIQSQINAFLFQSNSWLRSPFPPTTIPRPVVAVTPPTCRSWISVKVITLTTQQRLMALQSDSVSRRRSCRFSTEEQELSRLQLYVSPRQGEKKRKEKRCSAASFLSFCRNIRKGRHDTSAYLGATPAVSCVCVRTCVCVCFFGSEKGLTEAEIQMAVRGVGGLAAVRACVYWGCNNLTEFEFLLVDNCTFLPAEHRALLSTFSQVIYMTPTSFRQLSNHQNHSRGFSFGTCTKTQSVDVCKYAKIKMHTHTLLAPRPPSLSGHSQGQRRTHAPLNSALAIDERYCPELSSP